MAGYSKNIAVIRAIKGGFSADGGALSGLVKAEKYGGYLRAEVVKINFAPLSAGRYVAGISDGVRVVLCEGDVFEGNSDIDISCGFAALICFVRGGGVSPVATAVCGDYAWALSRIQEEVGRREGIDGRELYEDDAIAEDNYYEYGDGAQSGGAVRQDSQQKEEPRGRQDEDDFGVRQGQKVCKAPIDLPCGGGAERFAPPARKVDSGDCAQDFSDGNFGGIATKNNNSVGCGSVQNNFGDNFTDKNIGGEKGGTEDFCRYEGVIDGLTAGIFPPQNYADDTGLVNGAVSGGEGVPSAEEEAAFHSLKRAQGSDKNNGLGEGGGQNFYGRMHAEIERLLSDYPREEKLEQTVQGSRWVRINYGGGRYYVFGVIYSGQTPAYVCYGVPSKNSAKPPASLAGMASYIPAGRQGYWVMYQNAQTGESVKIGTD